MSLGFPTRNGRLIHKKEDISEKAKSSEVSVGKGSNTQPIRWVTEEVGLSNGRKKTRPIYTLISLVIDKFSVHSTLMRSTFAINMS